MKRVKKTGAFALLAWVLLLSILLTPCHAAPPLNAGEAAALADYIAGEAGEAPYAVQLAMAATLLNQRKDERYPDTVSGILTVAGYRCRRSGPIPDGARSAVWAAAEGMDITGGATAWARAGTAEGAGLFGAFALGDFVFGEE